MSATIKKKVLSLLIAFALCVGFAGAGTAYAKSSVQFSPMATSSYTAYTNHVSTTLYAKASTSSSSITIGYMKKLTVYGKVSSVSSGTWYKVKYSSKTRYIWVPKGTVKFVKKKPARNYEKLCTTELQKEVVDKAMYICDNWKTKYVSNGYGEVVNGVHRFDCSGYASYVVNTVVNKYNPAYKLTANVLKIGDTDVMYNKGVKGEFAPKKVCTKLNYSKLQPGDIILFKLRGGEDKKINHCGIYIGGKEFINCTSGAKSVCILPLTDMYSRDFIGAVRVIPDETIPYDNVMTAKRGITLYQNRTCSGAEAGYISGGEQVTVKYTYEIGSKVNAYVESGSQKGFVYDYKTKLR